MAKGLIKPTFGFQPIDGEPFLSGTTFPNETAVFNHAKNDVDAYPGKIISSSDGNSAAAYVITSVGSSGSAKKLAYADDLASQIRALTERITALETQLQDSKATIVSLQKQLDWVVA